MVNAIHSATNSPELGHRAVVDLHIWNHSHKQITGQRPTRSKGPCNELENGRERVVGWIH